MKKFVKALLLSGFLALGMTAFGQPAEAVVLEVDNQIGKPLDVAVVYHDETQNSWICRGWYIVKANSFRRLNFPNHARENLWVHMHNADRSWGGSQAWTVINTPFNYRLKNGCPSGPNRRQVTFRNFQIGENGKVRLAARNH